jgi:indoleamine 2,3-dioxygenase
MTLDLLDAIDRYEIDSRTGFVPGEEPLSRLSSVYDSWESIVPEISPLIRSRSLRKTFLEIELLSDQALSSHRERERALLLLSVFANGWVWGAAEPHFRIPPQIAVPLCAVAASLDRPPLVHYASMALNNWRRIDHRSPISAENARMQVQFLGGVDEDWFFIGSLGVELAGAPLLPIVHATTLASHRCDDAEFAGLLDRVADAMTPVLTALLRMREWCDPHIFYTRVRPYLAGWPAPGVIYEGVSEMPKRFVGGSAGQSALIQVIDALVGVQHDAGAGSYLREVRSYMSKGHRRFLESVERISNVKRRASDGTHALRSAYNGVIEQLIAFRRRHLAIAHEYIAKPSGMDPAAKGTGGTNYSGFLRDAQLQTALAKTPIRKP